MSVYLDASVLVPRVSQERPSDEVAAMLAGVAEPLCMSDYAAGELPSAFSLHVRAGRETAAGARLRLDAFDMWRAGACVELATLPGDVRAAALLVRRFELGLRMPDALHGATCLRTGLTLATLDDRIARAAKAAGVAVVMPAQASPAK